MSDGYVVPFQIGSQSRPGFGKLAEECAELIHVIGKFIATGGATQHFDGSNLNDRLVDELGDVLAAAEFVIRANDLNCDAINVRRDVKLCRFLEWHLEGTRPS